jgi:Ca2+-binding RTX toxin-like protein
MDVALAGLPDGGFVSAWMSHLQDGSHFGVYRQTFRVTEDGFGTYEADRMLGTSDNDYLSGLHNNDDLYGFGGDDVLEGGQGADKLFGGSGWDEASYQSAAGAVFINLLTGIHEGEAALDRLNSIEQLRLSAYNDRLIGSSNDDAAFGLAGDDQLVGGKGEDYLDGGAGNDILQGGKGADVLVGGTGWDEASYAQDGIAVAINLVTGTHSASALGDLFQSIEQFTLTQLSDTFTGAGGDDTVYGAGGNDQLTGGAGNNYLDGGTGNDVLNAGAGVDQLLGGLGSDEANYSAAAGAVTIHCPSGVHGGQAAGDQFLSIERYRLTGFGDTFGGTGAAEVVFAGAGDDAVNGGGGNDDLRGEAGNDTLNGAAGADAMAGGIGNDTYTVDDVGDNITEANGEGTDTVQSSIGFSLAGKFIENLTLTGSAAVSGSGNSLANVITGNAAANSLSGADGDDTLNGGGGADAMSGGIGNDIFVVDNVGDTVSEANGAGTDTVQSSVTYSLAGQFVENLVLTGASAVNGTGNSLANVLTGNSAANSLGGGDGADSLYGKGGNDTLNGGTGIDGFFFDTALGAGNVDTISSYSVADDTIMLDRTIFTGIGANGTLAAGAFVNGTAAADGDDRILYEAATGKIFYDADGNGAGTAVLFAQVSAGTALTNLDFQAYTPPA